MKHHEKSQRGAMQNK